MQYELSLEERTAESVVIIEGKVGRQLSYWNKAHTMIYTSYFIEVESVLKGNLTADTAEIIAEGGEVKDFTVHVNPGVKLRNETVGMFFLKKAPFIQKDLDFVETSTAPIFELFASNQGIIHYMTVSGAEDVFKTYANIRDVYSVIEKQTNKKIGPMPEILQKSLLKTDFKKDKHDRILATISSISPTTITAGTATTLTINGTGFGTTRGTGAVYFPNANNGGSSTNVPAEEYVSWNDTQIQVKVPTDAGTGGVVVDPETGTNATSGTLTVTYSTYEAIAGGVAYPLQMWNKNSQGGYTYTYNTDFAANTAARESFNRGMQEWRCSTFVNFVPSMTTTSTNTQNANDGVNVITFSNTLPSGVLGVCYTSTQGCGTTPPEYGMFSFDILFRVDGTGGINWNYGPDATTSGEYDFQTVATHEIGHGHLLGHIIASGAVMHFSISNGTDIRTLNASRDVAGGQAVISRSTSNGCGDASMTPLTSGTCTISDVPLPVELTGFTLTPLAHSVQVQWKTASEINNAGYEILRSDNGNNYLKIATYITNDNLRGLGNSAYGKEYSYEDQDENLQPGSTYWYKLVDVDFDGRRTEHEAKSVEISIESNAFLKVYPNPAKDNILVVTSGFDSESAKIELYSMFGEKIYEIENVAIQKGVLKTYISVNDFPAGSYLCKIISPTKTETQSFFVVR